jgi:hypothetical protein
MRSATRIRVGQPTIGFIKRSGYHFPHTRRAAHRNEDLGHYRCGGLRFLAIGPQNTYRAAPNRLPGTPDTINWRYIYIGFLDLQTGRIVNNNSLN